MSQPNVPGTGHLCQREHPVGTDPKMLQGLGNHCSPRSRGANRGLETQRDAAALAEPRVAPGTPDGPFNPGDNDKVAQWGCPVLGNCVCMWPSQFLPHYLQDAVMPPCSGAAQSCDQSASPQSRPTSILAPLCPAPGWHPMPRGRKRTVSGLALPPWSPIHAGTATFIPDVAGTAGAARHGNYSLPHPVPSRDGCFPHDKMLSKAPQPGLSSFQPQKGSGKAAGRAAGLCLPAQGCWNVPEGSGTCQAAPDPCDSISWSPHGTRSL